ncbi:MAG: outer membrane protein assembly factor BamD [Planctomycetota bacterium]
MNRISIAFLILLSVASMTSCSSFGRKLNQSLPDFLRSNPGEDEVLRYQERVRVLNRNEADLEAVDKAYEAAQALEKEEEWGDAAEAYEEFIKNFPDTRHDEEAHFRLVMAHRRDEEEFESSQALKKFLKRYPISRHNKEVEKLSYDMATEYVNGDHDGFLFGNRNNGVELFREQVLNFPNGVYAPDAYWRLGNHYYDNDEYFEAAAAYDTLLERYGDSQWASRALYNRALTRMTQIKGIDYDQQVMEQAVDDFKSYLRKYPEADRREDAAVYIEQIENMICEKQISIANWYDGRGYPGAARYYLVKAKRDWGHTEASAAIDGQLASLPDDEGIEVILSRDLPTPPSTSQPSLDSDGMEDIRDEVPGPVLLPSASQPASGTP